jgi:DNA modification methylase
MSAVTIGTATLYLGDCRNLLPEIQNIDALVVDPPYGISYCHSGHRFIGMELAPQHYETAVARIQAEHDRINGAGSQLLLVA